MSDLAWGEAEDPEVLGGIEPEEAGAAEPAELDVPVHVDPIVVRGLLQTFVGGGLGWVVGDPDVPGHWRFTERELDDLTPPLCRYINGRPRLREAVIRGDQLAIVTVLAGYVGRNISDGQQAARNREDSDNGDFGREDPRGAGGPAWHPAGAGPATNGPAGRGDGLADGGPAG